MKNGMLITVFCLINDKSHKEEPLMDDSPDNEDSCNEKEQPHDSE